ncbi:MAG TPA: hypothetical protein VGS21_08575 [Acidimicrobiales bacterium]|nr:hypothetical protein [Acidimicrobiales bacterium]
MLRVTPGRRRRRRYLHTSCAVVAVSIAAGGCSAYAGGSAQSRVRSWASSAGVVALDHQLASDVSGVTRARSEGKMLYVKTLCAVLVDDAEQAYVQLPAPDQGLNQLLASAYKDLADGGTDCDNGGGGGDAIASKGFGEIAAGSTSLQDATSSLARLGVK